MKRKRFLYFLLALVVMTSVGFLSQRFRNSGTAEIMSVKQFGPIKLGDKIISGGQGDFTFAPLLEIPASNFYVTIVQDESWCANEECGLRGAIVETFGGWLQMENPHNYPDLASMAGLDLPENQHVKSIVLIGDRDSKIVGIYPDKGLEDIFSILKKHPDLADFNFLNGTSEFGRLRVGELAPLKPGDSISHLSDELSEFSVSKVPKGKKFYIYALQKRKYDIVGEYLHEPYENEYLCFLGAGCRYPEPDPPHDFLFATMRELGGWFLANDEENGKMAELFGLNQKDVLSGKKSVVVLTDAKGVIRAIHPQKTTEDVITILSQHPELANVRQLFAE